MEKGKLSSDYQTEFDPNVYLEFHNKVFDVNNDEAGLLEFRMKSPHVFWSNFQTCSKSDEFGVRCLEFGGGPCITNLISASPKVDSIVFAEYLENNRKAVKSWTIGNPDAYNWSSLIEYVVCNLEGKSDAKAVADREEELKRKIKSIVPCDLTKADSIVDLEDFDIGKPFDVVTTSFCVEVCAVSEQQYKSTVAKLCKLLKPNGYLCMFGVLDESVYTFGKTTFYHYPVPRMMVDEAMREAGLQDIKIDAMELEHLKIQDTDATAFFFATGRMSGV